jgi:hypothetical protein
MAWFFHRKTVSARLQAGGLRNGMPCGALIRTGKIVYEASKKLLLKASTKAGKLDVFENPVGSRTTLL